MNRHHSLSIVVPACLCMLVFCRHAAADSPSPSELLSQIQRLIEQGKLAEARTRLIRGVKSFPHEAGLYNLLGVVEAQQGRTRPAESSFRRAIEEDRHYTGAYLNLGRLYQENAAKDPQALRKGLDTYRRLLRFDPANREANYQAALLLEKLGEFRASLEQLSRLSAPDQKRPQALALRCADFAGLGEQSQADAVAGELLSSDGLSEADVLSILPDLETGRRDDLQVRLLEGLVVRQQASADALFRLGVLYKRQEKLSQARVTLERSAQAQPSSVPVLMELARVANQQREYKGALGYLAHARDLEPQNASIHYFFGLVCVEERLVLEAYNSFKKAVSLEPDNPNYNYAFGALAVQRDNPREAIPYFQKYCAFKPDDPRGKLSLGAAYFYSRDYNSARKVLESVAAYRPTAPGAHYFLGRIANQEGNLEEAERELERALELNSQYANAYAELGILRIKKKEYQQAADALRHCIEIDPENYTGNLNLMVLYQRTKDPRADAQARRFEEVKGKRAEMAREFLRTIEVSP